MDERAGQSVRLARRGHRLDREAWPCPVWSDRRGPSCSSHSLRTTRWIVRACHCKLLRARRWRRDWCLDRKSGRSRWRTLWTLHPRPSASARLREGFAVRLARVHLPSTDERVGPREPAKLMAYF